MCIKGKQIYLKFLSNVNLTIPKLHPSYFPRNQKQPWSPTVTKKQKQTPSPEQCKYVAYLCYVCRTLTPKTFPTTCTSVHPPKLSVCTFFLSWVQRNTGRKLWNGLVLTKTFCPHSSPRSVNRNNLSKFKSTWFQAKRTNITF